MNYSINTAIFGNTFSVPCDVADKHLKLATLSQLKVLLYFMRNISDGINPEQISKATALPQSEVEDALLFWSQCGILKSEAPVQSRVREAVVVTAQMPSRADVIKRGLEDERLAFLLREAQLKFGRNLKQNENSLLVALYDDYGMDVSVILLLLGYAVSEKRCNISFIKTVASKWLNAGVETVTDAEALIADAAKQRLAWGVVQKVFGIEKRNPSEKELELSNKWVNEWCFGTDMLKAAYDVCVDSKTKLSLAYIDSILKNWHTSGFKTPADVAAAKQTKKSAKSAQKSDYAGYDLDLYEKMLNEDD